MTRFTQFVLVLSLAQSAAAEIRDQPEPINVYLYNYASVPQELMQAAVETAGKTLANGGLDTRWVRSEEMSADAKMGPSDLAMRVLPGAPKGYPKGVAGFAPLDEKTGYGRVAMVFQERIAKLVRRTDPKAWNGYFPLSPEMAESLVMGTMMAHEIGHLLLGVGSHSKKGLMAYPWGPRELHALARGSLRFSDEESDRILSRF